jgi:polyhydroxyalkanoate synthesis repressor PhaR
MAYVVKRYSNRKLYDTQESRYITLDEIQDMIRAGREIQVVDAVTGDDLTCVTLTQIILEGEKHHRGTLPASFLHQLIKHGEAWQDFAQRSMKASLEGIVSSQREMDRVVREWAARAGWPVPTAPRESRREAGPTAGAASGAAPAAGAESDADKLRDEVAALRERLKNLEERLERRKGEGR